MAEKLWAIVFGAVLVVFVTFGLPRLLAEVFPWQKLWAQRNGRPTLQTPSYQGRTVMITGANGAFGSRAAKLFASRNVDTLVLVDIKDCAAVAKQIELEAVQAGRAKPNIRIWQIDMMSFAGCKELGRRARELPALDHVLMTMGILSFARRESPEGWETSIQVNYLSNACAALLLIPLLSSSQTNPNPPVLTFITSFGIYPAVPTLSMPQEGSYLRHLSNNRDGLAQAHQYGRSKALLLFFARELAARLSKAQGIPKVTINSADPGTAWTPLTQPNRANPIAKIITDFGARDPEVCAVALVNGVSATYSGHGKIMADFGTDSFPPFMERQSGNVLQQCVWNETKVELEEKVPEVKQLYLQLNKE